LNRDLLFHDIVDITHCQFGSTLNDAVRDRLVCGLSDQHLQRRLLVEADLTFDRAKALAIAAETAARDAEELRKQPTSRDVNKLRACAGRTGKRPNTAAAVQCLSRWQSYSYSNE
jgi:hypothetical protein